MPNIEEILENELTDEQRLAATDPSKEVIALACAGSGKSRTLAYRIAWLLAEKQVSPKSIVAFTFTEKAAESIKLNVKKALDSLELDTTVLGAMYIGTIHSYCKNVLEEMDVSYRQYDVLDDNRLKLYLMSRYPQLKLVQLRKKKNDKKIGYFKVIEGVADAWKTVHDERVDIETVARYVPILGSILLALKNQLTRDKFLDFSLMIRLVVDALLDGDEVAERAVGHLQHLMVDEYQDVNPVQEELIRCLHKLSETLFVVGDDDQAIYAWRGGRCFKYLKFSQKV